MRESLWEFLTTEQAHENGELTPGWARDDCSTWTDERYNDPQAGLMGGAAHCDAFWQCRTLPRVCEGFATIYGTDELVTSFDRASINRPQACGSQSALEPVGGYCYRAVLPVEPAMRWEYTCSDKYTVF